MTQTIIITGASQGIGKGLVSTFLDRGYNVVATSRSIRQDATAVQSERLLIVSGDVGDPAAAANIFNAALDRFSSVDALVNNAGAFLAKPFIDYTREEFQALSAVNLQGFLYHTQLLVKHLLGRGATGSVVTITASLAANPILALPASVAMLTKGGLEAITRSLALEYARQGIRFNAVAPGVVDTPMHVNNPRAFLETLCPMATIATVQDIAAAVLYLTEAANVTGEVLHVDGGAHSGRW